MPTTPTSGRYMWWSNRGDVGHSYLERTFDLTSVQTATLAFDLWYDIEVGWDYAYVRVSCDGGSSWQLVQGRHMSRYDPGGNALGIGYTDASGSRPNRGDRAQPIWVRENLDLSAFLGRKIILRYDYVTDDAVNRPGMCLDSFELASIGYSDDVERDSDGWRSEGFIRHDNVLPQRWLLQWVEVGPEPVVRQLPVDPKGAGTWCLEHPTSAGTRGLLIVSAVTPYTTEGAAYRLEIASGDCPVR